MTDCQNGQLMTCSEPSNNLNIKLGVANFSKQEIKGQSCHQ